MKEPRKLNEVVALLARRLRCQDCFRRYRSQDFAQIEQTDQMAVFKLRCPVCLHNRLVIADWRGKTMRMLYSELDTQEWMYYRKAPAISSDDVIQIYLNMQSYDGDLSDVLEDPLLDEAPAL